MTSQTKTMKQADQTKQNYEELESINKELLRKNLETASILDAINFSSPTLNIDTNRKIKSVNKIFLFLSGLTKKGIIGKDHKDCFFVQNKDEYEIFWEMLLSGETIQKEEIFEIGEIELYLSIIYRPISDINGEIYYISCICTDLTESKRLENEIKDQIEIIREKNLYINQSLKYAETIQRSMMISAEQLRNDFNTELIFYPKDIVSGDFYWAAKTEDNTKVIAAVDCTGHGVPGAFLSFIGSKALDEIVLSDQVYEPDIILEFLHNNVKKALNQKDSNNKDGMDVSLCAFNETRDGKIKLSFSGAKLPLYYYKQSDKSLNYIKGSRKTIGGFHYDDFDFEEHELIMEKGDVLYLSTDGYIDQYSKMHKRFGKQRFQNMLNEVVRYPIAKQREIMEEIFRKFLSDESQRDDVTVLIVQL